MALIIIIGFFILPLGFVILSHVARAIKSSPKQKGKRGERAVGELLKKLPEEYTVLNDVVYRMRHGTTQIDHLVISPYAIFVIETKNYRGKIHGNDDREEWKQIIKTHVTYPRKRWKTYTYITKNKFYNPVLQSFGHATQVRKLLLQIGNFPIVPMVVFSDAADLSGVKTSNIVINSDSLLSCIRRYSSACISESELRKVRICLQESNVRDTVDNKTHKGNVRAAKEYRKAKIKKGICPRCGKPLVIRSGNYGSFYGCSGYPECRFTKKIRPQEQLRDPQLKDDQGLVPGEVPADASAK